MTKELSFEKDELTPEKTVPEIEAETRARLAADLNDVKKEAAADGQPIVNTLKKRSKHRILGICIFALALLIIVAWTGDRLYSRYNEDPKETTEQVKSPSGIVQHRTDLGTASNPFGIQPETQEPAATTSKVSGSAPVPQVATFNKSLALVGGSQTASQARSTQPPPDTAASASVETPPPAATTPPANTAPQEGIARVTKAKRLNLDPNLYIPVDRHIPCVMLKRFVSDVAGRTTCMISEDIYSANNFVKLLPSGSIASLIYKTGTLKNGMGRMFWAATEIRTPEPNALTIPMLNSQATGQLGELGVSGWIDEHWGERIGNTILLGTVQDFAAAAADAAPGKDRNTDYTENTRAATAEMAKTVLDNSINIPPTMYLNQGDVIGLSTGADIDFSGVYSLSFRK